MTIGTEGNDVLSNDRTLQNETIDALGGDDRIDVTTSLAGQGSTVAVNGGAGTDTLSISAPYISTLSADFAFIHEGQLGPQSLFRYQYPTSVSWTGIERLVVSGTAYFGYDGFQYLSGTWTTGNTSDEIHALGTLGRAKLTVDTGGGDDRIYMGNVGAGSIVYAGAGNDLIDAGGSNAGFLALFGGEGDDIVIGNPSGDYIVGGPGADLMMGGDGYDEYVVDDPGDTVIETAAGLAALIYTTLAVYTLPENVGSLRVLGGSGESVSRDYTLNSLSNTVYSDNADIVVRLQSGGDDYVYAGNGDNVFYFGNAYTSMDRVEAYGGSDTVILQGNYALTLSASSLYGMDILSLLGGANAQWGDTANNSYSYNITTVDGNVAAGKRLTVDAQSLRSGESLTFNGSAEADGSLAIYGGAGIDRITGGSGNDLISGGGGADTLAGGPGDDLFVYRSAADSPAVGRDRITGFALGDRIDLSAIDADPSTAGDDAFTFIGASAFSGRAGELRAVGGASGWTVSADLNGDGNADFSVVVLTSDGHLPTSGDFVL